MPYPLGHGGSYCRSCKHTIYVLIIVLKLLLLLSSLRKKTADDIVYDAQKHNYVIMHKHNDHEDIHLAKNFPRNGFDGKGHQVKYICRQD